jgi:hypothetical protein
MTFKKMLLLASTALGAIAFSAPASASAEWTHEGDSFSGTRSDILTGKVSFGNPAPGQTKFGCIAHSLVTATGGLGTTATIDTFEPTTETCTGDGAFLGCELVGHETTGLPKHFDALQTNVSGNLVYTVTGLIVIHNVYDAGCPIEKTTLTVSDVTLTTETVVDPALTELDVSGLAEAHSVIRTTGGEITQTVAVFGTAGTSTDTLTFTHLG